MNTLLQVAVIGVVTALLVTLIRRSNAELALLLTIAACVLMAIAVIRHRHCDAALRGLLYGCGGECGRTADRALRRNTCNLCCAAAAGGGDRYDTDDDGRLA